MLSQSQTDTLDDLNILEPPQNIIPSPIGREENQKLSLEIQNPEKINEQENFENDLSHSFLKRKVLDIDDINLIDEIELVYNNFDPKVDGEKSVQKLSEGMLWHNRLGHASLEYLKKLKSSDETLKNVSFNESIRDCDSCILAKMKSLKFDNNRTRAINPLQKVHADFMGQIKPNSFAGNAKYILAILDDFSRYEKTYYLQNKSEAGEGLESFIKHVRNIIGYDAKLCNVRADNAKEFTGGKFSDVISDEKAETDFSPPYTPELNGTAERFNETIQNKTRALLIDSGLPASMWILTVDAACYIYNLTPHRSNNFVSPLNKLAPNIKNKLEHLKRFGCRAFAKIPITKTKFSDRAIKCILVGFTGTGYILWHPKSGRFLISRHVRFNEKLVYKDVYKSDVKENLPIFSDEIYVEIPINNEPNLVSSETNEEIEPIPNMNKASKPSKRKLDNTNSEENDQAIRKQPRREAKINHKIKPIAYLSKPIQDISSALLVNLEDLEENLLEKNIVFALLARVNGDPVCNKEAIQTKDKIQWSNAIQDELNSMLENEVWDSVAGPRDFSLTRRQKICCCDLRFFVRFWYIDQF